MYAPAVSRRVDPVTVRQRVAEARLLLVFTPALAERERGGAAVELEGHPSLARLVAAAREAEVAVANPAPNAGKRWAADEDEHLARCFGPALRAFKGNTEKAVAYLAVDLGRSPVSIAARLCHLEIWRV